MMIKPKNITKKEAKYIAYKYILNWVSLNTDAREDFFTEHNYELALIRGNNPYHEKEKDETFFTNKDIESLIEVFKKESNRIIKKIIKLKMPNDIIFHLPKTEKKKVI